MTKMFLIFLFGCIRCLSGQEYLLQNFGKDGEGVPTFLGKKPPPAFWNNSQQGALENRRDYHLEIELSSFLPDRGQVKIKFKKNRQKTRIFVLFSLRFG